MEKLKNTNGVDGSTPVASPDAITEDTPNLWNGKEVDRFGIETLNQPEPEFLQVLGGRLDGFCTLSITADGKQRMYRLNRRRLLILLSSGFEALEEMEPGPWRNA